MTFNPLLLVMFPRRIPRCLAAIHALDIDKAYLSAMYEAELVPVIARIVDTHAEYTHFILLADDTVPTQASLDLVLEGLAAGHPVVTGFCNLDVGSTLVNLTSRPFETKTRSVWSDYAWMSRASVDAVPEPYIPTHFAGACLTGMTRAMWQRYPFGVNTHDGEPRGYCSDWNLCRRLQDDGVPIVAPRGAFVEHVKEDWRTQAVTDPAKRLLVGVLPAEVQWSLRDGTAYIEPVTDERIVWPVPKAGAAA